MILASLCNSKRFENMHPLFKQAFEYLKSTNFSKVEDGKYELEGKRLTASVTSLFCKKKEDAAIETHKKYIDIQMPLLGVEKIGWKAGCELTEESVPYNEESDITFYVDRPTAYTKIYPGQFVIYFPEDGHAPGIGEGNMRKVILKIAADEEAIV
ncbi:YhcH/YjgK/YiaL family protein [Parabacteroides bouchesdurhonensis]|uniref:YhcH/YjgK/YiaL family protein n=1 Tax=Parabacteroides bouchesdurhonensis TaxID=1936995 RepID=UPI000C825094|nr:YhcH/YjgK/YiaL family protein [Parabacteroides bouchesdurhonensis]